MIVINLLVLLNDYAIMAYVHQENFIRRRRLRMIKFVKVK